MGPRDPLHWKPMNITAHEHNTCDSCSLFSLTASPLALASRVPAPLYVSVWWSFVYQSLYAFCPLSHFSHFFTLFWGGWTEFCVQWPSWPQKGFQLLEEGPAGQCTLIVLVSLVQPQAWRQCRLIRVACSDELLFIDFTPDKLDYSFACEVSHRCLPSHIERVWNRSVWHLRIKFVMLLFIWVHIMSLPLQTGLYHDKRNYTSLMKTKAPPPPSTSTYQPRVGPPVSAVQLSTFPVKTEPVKAGYFYVHDLVF